MDSEYLRKSDIKKLDLSSFEFDILDIPFGYKIIEISPVKGLAYLAERSRFQRSAEVTSYRHDLPTSVEAKRIRSLINAVFEHEALPPIKLEYFDEVSPCVCLPDGLHRMTLFGVAGISSIPALVKIDEAELIINMLNSVN